MNEVSLDQKIIDGLSQICKIKNYKVIKKIEITVNDNIDINQQKLKLQLVQGLPKYISKRTKFNIGKEDLGELKAIIKHVDGR